MHQFPPDIVALIQAQMASGNYQSQDDLFRVALAHLAEQNEEVRAINESLDLLDAGDRGVALDEAFECIRMKHNLRTDA